MIKANLQRLAMSLDAGNIEYRDWEGSRLSEAINAASSPAQLAHVSTPYIDPGSSDTDHVFIGYAAGIVLRELHAATA